jgi:hypothetical protein
MLSILHFPTRLFVFMSVVKIAAHCLEDVLAREESVHVYYFGPLSALLKMLLHRMFLLTRPSSLQSCQIVMEAVVAVKYHVACESLSS